MTGFAVCVIHCNPDRLRRAALYLRIPRNLSVLMLLNNTINRHLLSRYTACRETRAPARGENTHGCKVHLCTLSSNQARYF
jgi:hypothetical protein